MIKQTLFLCLLLIAAQCHFNTTHDETTYIESYGNLGEIAQCVQALNDTFKEAQSGDPGKLLTMLLSTAHGVNDAGHFVTCNRNESLRYMTFKIIVDIGSELGTFFGICGPKQCKEADYMNLTSKYKKPVEDMMSQALQMNCTGKVTFDFNDPTISKYKFDFWSWIAFTLFIGAIMLVLMATVYRWYTQYQIEKKEQEQKQSLESSLVLNQSTLQDNSQNLLVDPRAQEPKTLGSQILDAFSIQTNYKKWIPDQEHPDTTLNVFHGLRFFNMFWIILGHQYTSLIQSSSNFIEILERLKDPRLVYVFGGGFAVDAFFFFSGFFYAFVALKKLKEKDISLSTYFGLLVHRYVRIVPTYFAAILVSWKISTYFGSGLFWSGVVAFEEKSCPTNFWKNLLFIQNFWDFSPCLGVGWYLAVDMQIFIVMPLITFILLRSKPIGISMVWMMIVGCVAYSFGLAWSNNWRALGMMEENNFNTYYTRPWCRVAPYAWGVLLCIWYLDNKKAGAKGLVKMIKENIVLQAICIGNGLLIMYFLVAVVEPFITDAETIHWTKFWNALYVGGSRLGFVIGLSIFILPSIIGGAKWVTAVLGNKMFATLQKLTFSMYLLHMVAMSMRIGWMESTTHIDHLSSIIEAMHTTFFTMLLAVAMYFLVEQPCANLEQLLLSGGGKGLKGSNIEPAKLEDNKVSA